MQPEDFSILYQDTDAGPWDAGASGSQTTFNNGRAVVAAATRDRASSCCELAADALEAAAGRPRARRRRRARQGLARPSRCRSPTLAETAPRRRAAARPRLRARRRRRPTSDASGCVGRLGMESFAAPTFITHAVARQGRPRHRRRAGARGRGRRTTAGTILNPIGAEGQVEGGVVMGIGQALSEGTTARRGRPPAQPAPARLQAPDVADAPPIDGRVRPDAGRRRRPERLQGRRPSRPASPTAGRDRERDRARSRATRVTGLPMTPERVWAAANGDRA